MDFDEVVEKAMDQMYYKNAFSEIEDLTKEIDIDSIFLVMTYASKKDDLSSVLLIPAWKFNGTITYLSDSASSEEPITVTINAVDGSTA